MKFNKVFLITLFLALSLILTIGPATAWTRKQKNQAPIANAGSSQTVDVGTVVQLDGSRCYDPNRQTITYLWIIQTRPGGSNATLSNQTSVTPQFTPDVAGNYVISLVVQDSSGLSSASSKVTITANPVLLPVAKAAGNQNVTVGTMVTLDGSGSTDPYGQSLTYQWSLPSKPSGSAAALMNPSAIQPRLTPDVLGNYEASLVVKDTSGKSSLPSTVAIVATSTTGSQQTGCYGGYWRFGGLGNIQVGANYDKVVYRIRAQHTGQVDSVRCYWMVATGQTYSSGSGGIMRCELQTDDGTANHLPSGMVLTSFQITTNAVQGANKANPLLGSLRNGCSFNRLYFDSPATVQAGQLYHIVFTNPVSDPGTNYWSVDCLWNNSPTIPKQPAYSDIDLQALAHFTSGLWDTSSHAPHATPIYTLYWTDGSIQGQPYMQLGYPLGIAGYPIFGTTNMIRQKFKVSGASKTVTAVNINMYKVGAPPDLTVEIQDSGGNTISQSTIPASTVSANSSNPLWGKAMLSSPITLDVGQTYYVEVSAPGGNSSNCYKTWSMQNGNNYGFSGDGFVDGSLSVNYGEYMIDGSNWLTHYDDMMIYFNLK